MEGQESKLQPCPFCGVDFNNTMRFLPDKAEFLHNCSEGFRIKHNYPELAKSYWNNAWAHKRIAELEREVESQKHCYRLLAEHLGDLKNGK